MQIKINNAIKYICKQIQWKGHLFSQCLYCWCHQEKSVWKQELGSEEVSGYQNIRSFHSAATACVSAPSGTTPGPEVTAVGPVSAGESGYCPPVKVTRVKPGAGLLASVPANGSRERALQTGVPTCVSHRGPQDLHSAVAHPEASWEGVVTDHTRWRF